MSTNTTAQPDLAEAITKALRRAYNLGQTYWSQADSESYAQNRRSDETAAKFQALIAETVGALPAAPSLTVGAEPVARLLHWQGPSHYPVPHGGIAARTFAEFPREAADAPDSYWKNGAPLYTQPPAQGVAFADGESPCVLEWGAVSLPMGDPSRVTNLQLYPTLWEAIAEGALCGFDWRVYPMALQPSAALAQAQKEQP